MGELPADVASALATVLAGAREVLGARFVGLYLDGSLATGDFARERSDIDFLVVTSEVLSDEVVAALADMHERLSATGAWPFAEHLEGSYIPLAAMRRYDPDDARHPLLPIGARLRIEPHDVDGVITRWILREHGVVIAGPEPRSFIDPVGAAELRGAVVALLRGFWARQLVADDFLRPREYQCFAVLTMCRALHALERGEMVSKPAAARWALENLDGKWRDVVARALTWPTGNQSDALEETRDFIRHALARIQPP